MGDRGMEVIQGGARNPHVVMTVKCAECGVQKGEVNHWWMLTVIEGSLIVEGYNDKLWGLDSNEQPVCGSSCAQKKLEQFLTTGKL
jgi:hypothetical protein